jgi:hypothetical protein
MENKTPEQKTREGLLRLKEKINKGKANKRLRRIFTVSAAAICVLVAFVVLLLCLKIKNINVSGDLSAYNETKVAEASEVDIGKSLMSKSASSIKKSIRKNIPLADDVRVRKNIFKGEVNIEITFLPFDYYIKYKDAYYAIDENLVVVDIRKNENDFSSLGGVFLQIPKTCRPILGKELVFYDTVPNPDGERETPVPEDELADIGEYQYIYDVLRLMKGSRNYDGLTSLRLLEKYDISAIYNEQYKVSFGSEASFELKLDVLSEIINDTSWQHTGFGEIDLRDPSTATARAVQSIYNDDSLNYNESDGAEAE